MVDFFKSVSLKHNTHKQAHTHPLGSTLVVKALLEQRLANPFDVDLFGNTPLHTAAAGFHQKTCEALLAFMDSPLGEEAPQDIVGVTPAGASLLASGVKKNKSKDEAKKRDHVVRMLHRVGDACISPVAPRSKRRAKKQYFGSCALPGFRVNMEDTVVATVLEGGLELYAVFDGHGGDGASVVRGGYET